MDTELTKLRNFGDSGAKCLRLRGAVKFVKSVIDYFPNFSFCFIFTLFHPRKTFSIDAIVCIAIAK